MYNSKDRYSKSGKSLKSSKPKQSYSNISQSKPRTSFLYQQSIPVDQYDLINSQYNYKYSNKKSQNSQKGLRSQITNNATRGQKSNRSITNVKPQQSYRSIGNNSKSRKYYQTDVLQIPNQRSRQSSKHSSGSQSQFNDQHYYQKSQRSINNKIKNSRSQLTQLSQRSIKNTPKSLKSQHSITNKSNRGQQSYTNIQTQQSKRSIINGQQSYTNIQTPKSKRSIINPGKSQISSKNQQQYYGDTLHTTAKQSTFEDPYENNQLQDEYSYQPPYDYRQSAKQKLNQGFEYSPLKSQRVADIYVTSTRKRIQSPEKSYSPERFSPERRISPGKNTPKKLQQSYLSPKKIQFDQRVEQLLDANKLQYNIDQSNQSNRQSNLQKSNTLSNLQQSNRQSNIQQSNRQSNLQQSNRQSNIQQSNRQSNLQQSNRQVNLQKSDRISNQYKSNRSLNTRSKIADPSQIEEEEVSLQSSDYNPRVTLMSPLGTRRRLYTDRSKQPDRGIRLQQNMGTSEICQPTRHDNSKISQERVNKLLKGRSVEDIQDILNKVSNIPKEYAKNISNIKSNKQSQIKNTKSQYLDDEQEQDFRRSKISQSRKSQNNISQISQNRKSKNNISQLRQYDASQITSPKSNKYISQISNKNSKYNISQPRQSRNSNYNISQISSPKSNNYISQISNKKSRQNISQISNKKSKMGQSQVKNSKISQNLNKSIQSRINKTPSQKNKENKNNDISQEQAHVNLLYSNIQPKVLNYKIKQLCTDNGIKYGQMNQEQLNDYEAFLQQTLSNLQ